MRRDCRCGGTRTKAWETATYTAWSCNGCKRTLIQQKRNWATANKPTEQS